MTVVHHRTKGKWTVTRDPALWQRCDGCGCFGVPEQLLRPGEPLSRHDYWMFASCPNAYECSLHDQYRSDCEEGRVMQKCFVAVHAELDIANHRLAELIELMRPLRREGSNTDNH